jgi:hypothetical protein
MIGRRSVIGLALLSALAVSAFAAQTASAVEATNTTAFTCVKGSGALDFADAHCDQNVGAGKGEYGHVAIEKETSGEATNEKVTNSTKDSEPAVLKSKVAGAKITIECAVVKGEGTGANKEIEKRHTGSGKGSTKFSSCNVKELTKCVVAEPIVASVTGVPLEGLIGPKEEKNAMGGEVKGTGAEETFTEIEFKNKGAEACAVNAKKFPVKGSATVTSGPTTESSQAGKSTGATAVYTPKFKMQNLKLGVETAEFSLITTVTANGIPLSGTTFT